MNHLNHSSMVEAGNLVKSTYNKIEPLLKPGANLCKINEAAHKHITSNGGHPAPLGYQVGTKKPFPASICISVNETVAHGFPLKGDRLREGDMVSIDISLSVDGPSGDKHFADSCRSYIIGEGTEEQVDFLESCRYVHDRIIWMMSQSLDGLTTGDIGYITQTLANFYGLKVAPHYGGHGIGDKLHLDPFIPAMGTINTGHELVPGMYITVEPIFLSKAVKLLEAPDEWPVVAPRGTLSAQFEHTVYIGDGYLEILT